MDINELKTVNERLQHNEDRIKEIEDKINKKEEKEVEAEGELKKAMDKYDNAVTVWRQHKTQDTRDEMEVEKYLLNTAKENLKRISDELKRLTQELKGIREDSKGLRLMWQSLKDELSEENRLKRQLEESSSSVSKRSSNSSRPGQPAFVKRLKDRDGNVCVISKSEMVKGAHIIPYAWATKTSLAEWKRDYEKYCRVLEHGVHDVRNGILLSSTLHDQFDDYWFTIEFKDDVYTVKTGNKEELKPLDGKVLEFPDKDTRPAPEFLARHNLMFQAYNLRAAAGHRLYRQNTDSTFFHKIPSDYPDKTQFIEDWIQSVEPNTSVTP